MPRFRFQPQRKHRWNMPSQQCNGGGKPAKRRLRKYTSNSLHRRRPKQWTENGSQEFPGQSVQQRHHGCSDQDQGRSDGHEQQMLNHVDGQQFLVEGCERRAHCQPDQEESEKETASSPGRNRVHGSRMKMKPPAKIQDSRQNHCESQSNRTRPGFQCDLNGGWHGKVISRIRFSLGLPRVLHRAREFALLDATSREMQRVLLSPPDSNSSHMPACCRRPGSPGG